MGGNRGFGSSSATAAKATPSAFDLDGGFDALLDGPTPTPAAASTTNARKEKKKKSYDSDSDDDWDESSRKKDKKKSKKKDRDPIIEDKSKRPLPTRKLPTPRPATVPDFEDDEAALFGIKKEAGAGAGAATGAGQKRASISASISTRGGGGVMGGEWDEPPEDYGTITNVEGGSGESTSRGGVYGYGGLGRDRSGSGAGNLSSRRDAQPSPTFGSAAAAATYLPDPTPLVDAGPPPVTFGNRRARNLSMDQSSNPPATAPPVVSHAPTAVIADEPPPRTFGSRRQQQPVPSPNIQPAPTPTHMPTEIPAAASTATLTTQPTASIPSRSHSRQASTAQPAKNIFDGDMSLPFDAPPSSSAPSSGLPDRSSSPIDDSNASAASVGGDMFGDLASPMDEIDDQGGNLFSGFGAARPNTTAAGAGPVRQRRTLINNAQQTQPPTTTAAANTRNAQQQQPTPQLNQPVRPSPPVSAAPIPAPAAASGPSGPALASTLQLWFDWLGVNPNHHSDERLVPIVHAASAAASKLPASWSLQNGWWVNSAKNPPVKHRRHPYLKHFLGKIDSKKLAIQFNVDDDDDELDESLVASGDERGGGGTPSSLNRSIDDSTFNPLSPGPISPKTRKFEANAAQPKPMQIHTNGRPGSGGTQPTPTPPPNGVNTLSINTASSPAGSSAGPNVTPSPWYNAGANPGAPQPSPPLSSGSSASSVGGIPVSDHFRVGSFDSTRSDGVGGSFVRLESVPERMHGRTDSMASQESLSDTAQSGPRHESLMLRQAEADRALNERLAQAAQQAAAASAMTHGGSDARIVELQSQLRLQSITLEELEKRKRSLLFELEQADVHMSQVLHEQRSRHEAQMIEAERRNKVELDAKRLELQRSEATYNTRIQELEDRLKSSELKRSSAITQAVAEAESKHRDTLDHALKMASTQAESQRAHYEREIESMRTLHQAELASIKQQQHDSIFLRSLVSQVESSASHVENLSKKVFAERASSERLTFDQLQVRDRLLSEKESSLADERKNHEELIRTFQKLQRENEEEKIRLREEHIRLVSLQNDFKAESAVLKEQFIQEREQCRKERTAHAQQKDAWEQKYKREAQEIETKKEMNERAHSQMKTGHAALAIQSLESLSDAQRERGELMKQLDDERDELRLEKRSMAQRRRAIDEAEATLRADEAEFATHVKFFEQRLAELQLLGARVKAQSAEVADQYARLASERTLIEDAKKEARQFIDLGEKAKQSVAELEERRAADKKESDREKVKLLAAQKQLLIDQDRIAREFSFTKSIAGFNASLPKHLAPVGGPTLPMPITTPSMTTAYAFGINTDFDQKEFPSFHSPPLAAFEATGQFAPPPPISAYTHTHPHPHSASVSDSAPPGPVPVSPAGFSYHASPATPHVPLHSHSQPQPHDSDSITAALAALAEHTDHLKHFLTEEKIITPIE